MNEYISRNEVYQKLHEAGGCDASDEWARGYDAGITEAIDIIDNIPPADVAPVVHGHWIREYHENDVYSIHFVCSNCKTCMETTRYERKCSLKFCSECGAKMDESEENENG